MKTLNRLFKKDQEEVILADHSLLLKITIGLFTVILMVCISHQANIL